MPHSVFYSLTVFAGVSKYPCDQEMHERDVRQEDYIRLDEVSK